MKSIDLEWKVKIEDMKSPETLKRWNFTFEDPNFLFYAYDYDDADGNGKTHNNETNY